MKAVGVSESWEGRTRPNALNQTPPTMSEPRRSARAPAPIVPIMKPAPETKAKKAPAKAAAKGGKRAQYDEDDDESDEDEEESEDDFEERKKPAKKAKVAAKKAPKVEEEKVTVAALKLGDTLS